MLTNTQKSLSLYKDCAGTLNELSIMLDKCKELLDYSSEYECTVVEKLTSTMDLIKLLFNNVIDHKTKLIESKKSIKDIFNDNIVLFDPCSKDVIFPTKEIMFKETAIRNPLRSYIRNFNEVKRVNPLYEFKYFATSYVGIVELDKPTLFSKLHEGTDIMQYFLNEVVETVNERLLTAHGYDGIKLVISQPLGWTTKISLDLSYVRNDSVNIRNNKYCINYIYRYFHESFYDVFRNLAEKTN